MEIQERRAVLTVPSEAARESCWGKRLLDLEDRNLRQVAYTVAKEFVARHAKQGERYIDRDEVHIYGPFKGDYLLPPLVGRETAALTKADREQLALDEAPGAFAHYLLNAHFLVAPQGVLERSDQNGLHPHPHQDQE